MRAAHSLKGQFKALGAGPAAPIVEQLELLGGSGRLEGAVDLLARLEPEIERLLRFVTNECPDLASRQPALPALPVVMVTCNHDRAATAQALTLGASDYLPKPISFQYLDEVLAIQLPDVASRGPDRTIEVNDVDATWPAELSGYAACPGATTRD